MTPNEFKSIGRNMSDSYNHKKPKFRKRGAMEEDILEKDIKRKLDRKKILKKIKFYQKLK